MNIAFGYGPFVTLNENSVDLQSNGTANDIQVVGYHYNLCDGVLCPLRRMTTWKRFEYQLCYTMLIARLLAENVL